MFQSILSLLFSCSHRRTTFPQTAGRRDGALKLPAGARTYVVCLDCGKELAYDWSAMRVASTVTPRLPAIEAQPIFR
jgi:hypothetical protein